MMKHTLELLQYKDVIKIVAKYCVTDEGREKALTLQPKTDTEKIDNIKDISKKLLDLQHFLTAPTIKYFPPIAEYISDEKVNLQIEEIYAIGLFTKSLAELQNWRENFLEKNTENSVTSYVGKMPDLPELYNIIFSTIDKDGNLQKTPELKKIEKEILLYEDGLQKALRHYFSDNTYSQILQANVPTIKDGRQVIAVKSNYKGRISGIIHEYSQSGQTFYIEPSDIVEKNNDIIEAQSRYNAELKRILADTSKKIFSYRKELSDALYLFASFDLMSASARLAKEESWVFLSSKKMPNSDKAETKLNANSEIAGSFFLKQARHPLLKNPVPIDIALPEKTKVLIITGPNAGGKTVTLKTICLFALLNQSGLPVPCASESRLPYFDFVACDIGDAQSIDLSLSTFSSHMKNISEILGKATNKSLIALDELGSGTEPQEGSAIAMAILDELLKRQSYVFVTSHHGSLKNYGYTKEHCENASVAFDNTTLLPSYKIIMGVPGESHAFDIASKSGLSKHIIENAKKFLGEDRADVSKLITDLIEKNKTADKIISTAKEKEQYTNEKIRKVDLKELKLKQKELNLREQGYRQLENFFLEKRKELENLIRTIREGELNKEKILFTKNWLDTFESDLQNEKAEISKEKKQIIKTKTPKQKTSYNFAEGDSVFSLDYNQNGIILRKEKNNSFLVELGSLKFTISADRLEPTEVDTPKVSVGLELAKIEKPVFELRLLGMRELEAKKALTKQLDLAVMSNLKEFSIIHGKGDGILQKMVHSLLSKTNFIEDFYFARPEDGGTGKTFVRLK